MKKLKHLLEPRVKNPKFSEWSEEKKDQFLISIKKIYDTSSWDEFFKMDVSQLDDNQLFFLIMMNLNVIEKGSKYLDLYLL